MPSLPAGGDNLDDPISALQWLLKPEAMIAHIPGASFVEGGWEAVLIEPPHPCV